MIATSLPVHAGLPCGSISEDHLTLLQALRGPGPGLAARRAQHADGWERKKRKHKVAVYFEDDSDSASQPSGRGKKKQHKRRLHGADECWHSGPMPDVLKVSAEPRLILQSPLMAACVSGVLKSDCLLVHPRRSW